jgi:hypothetical protein
LYSCKHQLCGQYRGEHLVRWTQEIELKNYRISKIAIHHLGQPVQSVYRYFISVPLDNSIKIWWDNLHKGGTVWPENYSEGSMIHFANPGRLQKLWWPCSFWRKLSLDRVHAIISSILPLIEINALSVCAQFQSVWILS